MAKNSFVIYDAWGTMIDALPDNMAGRVFKALFAYREGNNIEEDDPALYAILAMFFNKMDDDAAAYEEICKRNKKNAERDVASGNQSQPVAASGNQSHTDNDNDNDNEYENEPEKKKRGGRFVPPTLAEVKAYCQQRVREGHPAVNPETFLAYYESQNWKKANGQRVSDWKGCVRTWEQRNKDSKPRGDPKIPTRYYDFADIERRLVGR